SDLFVFRVRQKAADLGSLEPAMAPQCADGRDLPGAGPSRDCLRIDPEESRHLGWGQECVRSFAIDHGIPSSGQRGTWFVTSAPMSDSCAEVTPGAIWGSIARSGHKAELTVTSHLPDTFRSPRHISACRYGYPGRIAQQPTLNG